MPCFVYGLNETSHWMQIILPKVFSHSKLTFYILWHITTNNTIRSAQATVKYKSLSKHLPIKFPKKMPISNSFPLIKLPKLYTSHILETYSFPPQNDPPQNTHTNTHTLFCSYVLPTFISHTGSPLVSSICGWGKRGTILSDKMNNKRDISTETFCYYFNLRIREFRSIK